MRHDLAEETRQLLRQQSEGETKTRHGIISVLQGDLVVDIVCSERTQRNNLCSSGGGEEQAV